MLNKIKRIIGLADEVDALRREITELRSEICELKKKRISDRTTVEEPVTPSQVFNEYLGEGEENE